MKKGFTLIELLAVIVILAIIALIATPIVMNVIENARKSAAERSAEGYIDAVETAVATEMLDNEILEGAYNIQSNGSLCPVTGCGDNDIDKTTIDMNGNKPSSGTIFIKNGVVIKHSTIDIDGYRVTTNNNGSVSSIKLGRIVYRRSEDQIKIGQEIDLNDTETFKTNPADLETSVYLKHVLDKDNKVVESYACGIFGEKEICLRGGKDAEGNLYHNENKLILENLDTKGFTCDFDKDDGNCSVCINNDGVYLQTEYNGTVDVWDSNYVCDIYGNGSSQCKSR